MEAEDIYCNCKPPNAWLGASGDDLAWGFCRVCGFSFGEVPYLIKGRSGDEAEALEARLNGG